MSVNPYEPPITASLAEAVEPRPIWDDIEMEYELTIDDLVAFNIVHSQASPAGRRLYVRLMLFLSALILSLPAIYLALTSLRRPETMTFETLLWIGGFIVIGLILVGIALLRGSRQSQKSWIAERLFRSQLSQGNTSAIVGSRRLRVTKEHLEEWSPLRESRWKMEAVQRILVTPQYIFIYMAPMIAFVLPARAFLSPDHRAAFITNLEAHSGKRAEQFGS